MHFVAEAHLTLTPVNPLTGAPTGESYWANVLERHDGTVTDLRTDAAGFELQHEVPAAGETRGMLREQLRAASQRRDRYALEVRC